MSLNLATLKTDLEAVYDATLIADTDAAAAKTAFVNGLANAFDKYVKTASLTYASGLVAGSVPVTGSIIGGIE